MPIGAEHVGDPATDATTAFVGDPLFDLDSAAGTLYALSANQQGGAASVAKSFTVLLAVEAMLDAQDPIGLGEVVTISANIGALTVEGAHSLIQPATNGNTLEVGEKATFGDLLLGIMSTSAADASVAVAEHVAKRHLDPGCSTATWTGCEAVFVERMNERAAGLGLVNTNFTTPYGAQHEHDANHQSTGVFADYRTTAREIAKWFEFGWQYPEFRRIIGFQSSQNPDAYSFNTVGAPSGPKTYNLVQNGFNYPGADGGKGGNNAACGVPSSTQACQGQSATRMGRQVIVAYLNSTTGRTPLLDYGFQTLFHPKAQGLSAGWKAVVDQSTACVSHDHAATASVTPSGYRQIVLWDVDIGDETIALASDAVVGPVPPKLPVGMVPDVQLPPPVPPDSLKTLLDPIVEPVERWVNDRGWSDAADFTNQVLDPPWTFADDVVHELPPPPPPDGTEGAPPPPPLLQVELIHLGGGLLVLAERTVADVTLHLWGITATDKLVHLDGPRSAGSVLAQDMRLVAVTPQFFAVGVLGQDGFLRVSSWQVQDNELEKVEQSPFLTTAEEFDLARVWGWLGPQVVAAYRDSGTDDLSVRVWLLDPFDGGLATWGGVVSTGVNGFDPRVVPVPMKQLATELDAPLMVGVASRSSNDQLRLDFFDLAGPAYVPTSMSGGNLGVSADGDIEVAPLRTGGVVTATRSDAGNPFYTVRVWDANRPTTAAITARAVVDQIGNGPTEGVLGLCKVPYPLFSQPSEGDYLLPHLDDDGKLRLAGWRVAPRPT